MEVCLDKKNLGLSACAQLPQMPRGMITTPASFKATPTQAVDPAFWQAALKALATNRIYLWPFFDDFKDNSEKAVYQMTPLSVIPVRDGRYDFEFDIAQNLCLHKAMFTHRSNTGRVFLFDVNGNLFGTTDSNGNFVGFNVLMLNTEKLILSNGTVATMSPIRLVLANNLEVDQSGALLTASFVNSLIRLTDVDLTVVGTPAASGTLVVDVTQSCDGVGVSGLVLADFVFKKTDGTAQTTPATTAVESTTVPGRYTLSKTGGTAWATGTIDLVAASVLSITAYESTGPAVVTPV